MARARKSSKPIADHIAEAEGTPAATAEAAPAPEPDVFDQAIAARQAETITYQVAEATRMPDEPGAVHPHQHAPAHYEQPVPAPEPTPAEHHPHRQAEHLEHQHTEHHESHDDGVEHGQHAARHTRRPPLGVYRDSEFKIRIDKEIDRRPGRNEPQVLVSFGEKPDPETRQRMKDEGFRFEPDVEAWSKPATAANLVLAKRVVNDILKSKGSEAQMYL